MTYDAAYFIAKFERNDGHDPRHQQPTPKQRVLAALRDLS